MLRVIIAGYDKMLAALINGASDAGHEVVGVIRIDRVKYNRFTLFLKDIFVPSKDFSYIKSKNLYEIKAGSVNSKKFRKEVLKLKADLILVGSWSEKFLIETIELTKYGVINCHPSLLPKHRGANPYFWQIYSGDTKAGITFHYMDEGFDTGDILMQGAFDITPSMTGGSLKTKTCKVAEVMTGQLLSDLEENTVIPVKQDETKATYDKWSEDLRIVDFEKEPPYCLHNKIRGMRPFAYPVVNYKGINYRIGHSELTEENNFETGIFKKGKFLYARYNDCTLKLTLL
ncbi:MAG: formyltransferase family protein [bacterium]|nr:formyltransferase family protein [bacterium]